MDVATENLQWQICQFCGGPKQPDINIVAKLISSGMTKGEAQNYANQHTYLKCPKEHGETPVLHMPFIDGAYYHGRCRNAVVARYVAATNRFVYMREKFRYVYPESIGHAENDNGFDLFRPYGILENPPFEIPQLTDR